MMKNTTVMIPAAMGSAPRCWMFGLIGIALFFETIAGTIQHRGADPIAAGIMTVVFFIMTYLFATTRVKD